jgi:hypothetical protein
MMAAMAQQDCGQCGTGIGAAGQGGPAGARQYRMKADHVLGVGHNYRRNSSRGRGFTRKGRVDVPFEEDRAGQTHRLQHVRKNIHCRASSSRTIEQEKQTASLSACADTLYILPLEVGAQWSERSTL